MKPAVYRTLTWVVLPVIIVALVVAIIKGIKKPIDFDNEKQAREQVAIQRLKDIRTLETVYKSETGRYTSSADTLRMFYLDGKISVEMQIGSSDDSVAVAYTDALKKQLKKKSPKMTDEQFAQKCHELYNEAKAKGDDLTAAKLVFTIKTPQLVRSTLFLDATGRTETFNIDSTFTIPFCGKPVIFRDTVKEVSGVPVPLFEACMPYRHLLAGMDNQLRINLDAEKIKLEKYPGLKVGDIEKANNNAGNWE